MRAKLTLAVAAAFLCLGAVTGCGPEADGDGPAAGKNGSQAAEDGSQAGKGSPQASPGGTARSDSGQQGNGGTTEGLPHAGSLRGVETFLGKTQLPCYDMSSDPADDRLPADGFVDTVSENASAAAKKEAAAWSIKEEGVCGEDWTNSYLVYMPSDMRAFQQRYKEYVLGNDRSGGSSSLTSGRFLIGEDFAVDPAGKIRDSGLLATGLLLLNCDPGLKVPSGHTERPALVDGCVLTDYVAG